MIWFVYVSVEFIWNKKNGFSKFFFLLNLVAFGNKSRRKHNNYSYNHFKQKNFNLFPFNPE